MSFDRDHYMSLTYGFATSEWEDARTWIARRLQRVARERSKISYGELVTAMSSARLIGLEPDSPALAALLGQVNVLEMEAGRPLISALVVHRDGDMEPGSGFWRFARELGVKVGSGEHSRLDFWSSELARCYEHWRAS